MLRPFTFYWVTLKPRISVVKQVESTDSPDSGHLLVVTNVYGEIIDSADIRCKPFDKARRR